MLPSHLLNLKWLERWKSTSKIALGTDPEELGRGW